MQGAVDGNDVTLSQHLLEILNTSAANLLLDFRLQWLVVKVEQFFAVEGLQSAEHTLANAANSDCSDNLVFEIILVLGHSSDIPVTALDLLVCRDEVSDEKEDSHDDMLGDGDDVGAGDFGNSDTTIGLVGSVQVDVVGANAGGDGDLQLLRLCETLSCEVTGVEAGESVGVDHGVGMDLRSGNDDFSVYQLLVESGILAFLVGGGYKSVSLILEPFSDAQLVLGGT